MAKLKQACFAHDLSKKRQIFAAVHKSNVFNSAAKILLSNLSPNLSAYRVIRPQITDTHRSYTFLNTNHTNVVYLQTHVYIRLVLYFVSNFNSLHKTNLFLAILLACGELGRMATLPEAIQ